MKVIELKIENFKNITAATIVPRGNTVIISGENGAGKTAAIDSLWMALDQKGAIKENPDPIKHGKKHAKVTVNLGKYVVTRTWSETKSYLQIANTEGAVFKGPGAMLSSLIGELSFDPQAFSLMSEKEQRNTLINMLDISIDIPAQDMQRKDLYNARTLVNRDISILKGQRDGFELPEFVPDNELSAVDIITAQQEAMELIATKQRGKDTLTRYINQKAESEAKIVQLRKEIEELTENVIALTPEIIKIEDNISKMIDQDIESFKCQIEDIEKTNALVRKKQERQVIVNKLNSQTTASNNITNEIKNIDTQKADAIRNATMPVPGLSFNQNGVLYNDIPIKGCSAAEQLRVSVAMAMELNPKIRVIRITDGSLLDSSNMKIIEEMAQEEDFQVWVERVDESGKIGVFIQEGEVVHDNYMDIKESVAIDNDQVPDETPRAQTNVPVLKPPK